MKTKTVLIISVVILLLFQFGCGSGSESERKDAGSAEAVSVPRMKVTLSSLEDFYEATGTVQAKTTTQVSANIMGRITSLPFSEGDVVSRGQVLIQIDNSENKTRYDKAAAGLKEARAAIVEVDRSAEAANAAVRTAEASRDLAEKTFVRIKELYDRKSATGQEFDEAQSRVRMAVSEAERAKASVQTILSKKKQIEARIEQAQADIAGTKVYEGYSKIASPVSGVIVKKLAEQGAVASPGQPILSIEDNSRYRLEAAVETSRSDTVRIGERVNVRIDALGQPDMFGTISEVLPSADPASRTLTVKIDLPANSGLRSGLYGLARFPISAKEAIAVPETAIVQRGQLTGVFIIAADGTAQFRIVTTGKTSDGLVEVLSGLSVGDEIVSADAQRVNDGSKIK
jgi:multidrug efflux pump subunit AcrA (membrane-fusion protein)